MARIDIITTSGLTANDGSIIYSGATIKFQAIFFIGSNDVEIRPRVFRSRELYEQGFDFVETKDIPRDFKLTISDEEYYTLTPAMLYERVNEYLNLYKQCQMFEIQIIQ